MLPLRCRSLIESERLKRAISLCHLQANPYIPHKPTPKQLAFLLLDNLEAFYGGAAGGGKSDALLMAALQYVDIPGYAAIIFRKNYSELTLPGALLDRSREWLSCFSPDVIWKEQEKTWHLPSGATVSFGYLDNDADMYRYQSAEFQFIGFDELTEFNEKAFRFLFSRLRRLLTSEVPLRMRAASNPGGIGHDWVKNRFIVEGLDKGRIFIPATLDDNPFLDRESYIKSLDQLDPITRQRLLLGDWSARDAGNLFKREWFDIVEDVPTDIHWIRYWDMAATEATKGKDPDWTAGCKIGRHSSGKFYIADMTHLRASPQGVEARVLQTAKLDGQATRIYIEQEPGAGGKTLIDYYTRQLAGYSISPDRPATDKVTRASPAASQAEAGNILLVRSPWVTDFLDEVEAFPVGSHDDQVDTMSAGLGILTSSSNIVALWQGAAKLIKEQNEGINA
jgi:predicted phage terminase large subunit-like protein